MGHYSNFCTFEIASLINVPGHYLRKYSTCKVMNLRAESYSGQNVPVSVSSQSVILAKMWFSQMYGDFVKFLVSNFSLEFWKSKFRIVKNWYIFWRLEKTFLRLSHLYMVSATPKICKTFSTFVTCNWIIGMFTMNNSQMFFVIFVCHLFCSTFIALILFLID